MTEREVADRRGSLGRVGGISALAIGIGYVVIVGLYASVGPPPSGGQAWLDYGAGKTTAWWGILGLSVLTDLLFVPLALALYLALRGVNRDAMLVGSSLVLVFVVVDLSVTWSNYAALITLADDQAAAGSDAQRAADVAAATYASAVLTSPLEVVYSIGTLALGILIIGFVMLGGVFGRPEAVVGLATGVFGLVAVVSGFFTEPLTIAIILASLLTTVWVFLVGYRLVRLASPPA
jgi:hypothetical protein